MPARPPRTPKGERWGGRAKGTPNKRTAEGQAIFAKLNFDCIEESIELFREWKTRAMHGPLKQRRVYQDLMSQLLGRMTQYQYARLRSIDMKVEGIPPEVKSPEERSAEIARLQAERLKVMPYSEIEAARDQFERALNGTGTASPTSEGASEN